MRWCVIRHPGLGLAVVAEPSLVVHRPLGWARASEFTTDRDSLDVGDYADGPDLDADQQSPADTDPDAEQKPAAKNTKAATAGKRGN